jgi:hypothetical protein
MFNIVIRRDFLFLWHLSTAMVSVVKVHIGNDVMYTPKRHAAELAWRTTFTVTSLIIIITLITLLL